MKVQKFSRFESLIRSGGPEQQRIDRDPIVHAFAAPARGRGARVDHDAALVCIGRQERPVRQRLRVARRAGEQRFAVLVGEPPRAVVAAT